MTTPTAAPPPPSPAEWRLLLAGLTVVGDAPGVPPPPPDDVDPADAAAAGDAASVLAGPAADAVVRPPGAAAAAAPADAASAAAYWAAVAAAAATVPADAGAARGRLAVGAAALALFVRANFTGPPLGKDGCLPAWVGGRRENEEESARAPPHPPTPHGDPTLPPVDAAALARLAASGEDADAVVAAPAYGALAVEILLRPLGCADGDGDGAAPSPAALAGLPPTWAAWALRAVAARQRVLSSRAAATSAALAALAPAAAAAAAACPFAWARRFAVPGAALEAAAAWLDVRDTAHATACLSAAEEALGVSVRVDGALGVRTLHQADPKAQLVAVVEATTDDLATWDVGRPCGWAAGEGEAGDGAARPRPDHLAGLAADVDVLRAPRLMQEDAACTVDPPLVQALLLLRGALVAKSTADDGLRAWRAAPFAERVAAASPTATRPALAAAAAVARARHERERGRTRERALVTLEAVTAAAAAAAPPPAARLPLALASPLPPLHRVAREGADALLAAGVVGAALDAYVGVEAWDAVALCHRLLGHPAAARDVIERRLALRPADPRLLCSLGDVTGVEAHYVAALEATGGRSARAHRALATRAGRRKDWAAASSSWAAALALNPAHTDGWFSLGYAQLKAGDDAGAAHSFTRVVADDRDHGDAWNNLAAIHLRARRPAAAYVALQQAVRLKRDSWQAWSNLAGAALAARAPLAAARAVGRVLELTRGEERPVDVMEGLVAAVVEARARVGRGEGGGAAARVAALSLSDGDDGDDSPASSLPSIDLSLDAVAEPITTPRDVASLEAAVGAALRAATRGGGAADPAVWGALASFSDATGSALAAREARLKRVRLLTGGAWREDAAAYAAYVSAVVALADADVAAVAADGGRLADLAAAKMALAAAATVGGGRWGEGAPAVGEARAALARVEGAVAVMKGRQQ